MLNFFNKKKLGVAGFTLIELLVVIAIIGVLASVVLTSLATARAKARDARRISDLKQMVNAIAQLSDTQGFLPTTAGLCGDGGGRIASSCTTPALGALNDPSTASVCPFPIVAGTTCNYRVVRRSAAGQPSADDYVMCSSFEQPSNWSGVAGAHRITSASNYGIEFGDCPR